MALQVTNLTRSFTILKGKEKKEIKLADPNPNMSPEEVAKFYSSEYPELTNAKIEGPIVANKTATYKITTEAGQLG